MEAGWQCSLGWLGFSLQAGSKADNEDSQSRSPLHNAEGRASGGLAFLTVLPLQRQYQSTGILRAEGRVTPNYDSASKVPVLTLK